MVVVVVVVAAAVATNGTGTGSGSKPAAALAAERSCWWNDERPWKTRLKTDDLRRWIIKLLERTRSSALVRERAVDGDEGAGRCDSSRGKRARRQRANAGTRSRLEAPMAKWGTESVRRIGIWNSLFKIFPFIKSKFIL